MMTGPRIDDFEMPGEGPAPGAAPWPPAAKTAVGVGIGCAALVLLEFAVIWAGITVTFGARAPEGLRVKAVAPKRAAVGTKVPLTLTVRNQGEAPFTVRSLAVRSSTLRSYRIENPRPASSHGPVSVFGSTVWTFEQPVAPGKDWTVRFDVTPVKPGAARGVVEVQVGTGMRSADFTIEAQSGASTVPVTPAPTPIGR